MTMSVRALLHVRNSDGRWIAVDDDSLRGGNLVTNGMFVGDVDGWAPINDEAVEFQDTNGASSDGSGCMSVNRLSGTAGVAWAPDAGPVSLGGLSILNFSIWTLSGHADVEFFGRLDFYSDATYDNFVSREVIPPDGSGFDVVGTYQQVLRMGILVPAAATHVDISLRAVGLDNTDPILYDNIAVWGTS